MKKLDNKSVRVPAHAQARIGIIAIGRFRSLFQSNSAPIQHDIQVHVSSIAGGEKDELTRQIDAELKRAQAQTYANALILR